jgi:hypothetical protein
MASGLTFLALEGSPPVTKKNEKVWYALQVASVVFQDDAVLEHPPNVLDQTSLKPGFTFHSAS